MVNLSSVWLLVLPLKVTAHHMHFNLWHYGTPAGCSTETEDGKVGIISDGKCSSWSPPAAQVQMQWLPTRMSEKSTIYGSCEMTLYEQSDCSGAAHKVPEMEYEHTFTNMCLGSYSPEKRSARLICSK